MKTAPGLKILTAYFDETSASPMLTGRWDGLLAIRWDIRIVEGQGLQVLDASVEYIHG
jgi:hypothetical protein